MDLDSMGLCQCYIGIEVSVTDILEIMRNIMDKILE